MNSNWISAIATLNERNESFVLVTVLAVRGSTPRDADSKMVVTAEQQFDSIGGGNLEYQATHRARNMLTGSIADKCVDEFSLGASLGQCCGGHATLLFEHFPATALNVVLFGGGHVASALASVLQHLPVTLRWLDSREVFVSEHENGLLEFDDDPAGFVSNAPAQSVFLIMTHDHSLDFDICESILKRMQAQEDVQLCGLIGSKSKSAKFRSRLKHRNYPSHLIERVQCPIGSKTVPGKRPMEVAVSIAAELIRMYTSANPEMPSTIDRRKLLTLVERDNTEQTG